MDFIFRNVAGLQPITGVQTIICGVLYNVIQTWPRKNANPLVVMKHSEKKNTLHIRNRLGFNFFKYKIGPRSFIT